MAFIIKKYLCNDNKILLKHLNNYFYGIASINFILDNNNNLYFYINDNKQFLFYNHSNILLDLLSYLKVYYKDNIIITLNYINKNDLINKDIIFLNDNKISNNLKKLNHSDYYFIKLFNCNKKYKHNYFKLMNILNYIINKNKNAMPFYY